MSCPKCDGSFFFFVVFVYNKIININKIYMYKPELQLNNIQPKEAEVIPKEAETTPKEEKKEEGREDFLMSPLMLTAMKKNRDLKKADFLERLKQRLDSIVGESRISVFDKIIKANEENRGNEWKEDMWEGHIDDVMENINPDDMLIDIPEEKLGALLRPLPRENQERIYVQRDKYPVKRLMEPLAKYGQTTDIAFHVSDLELKDVLKAGKGENAVYFSTNIKRLFYKKESKYIYAFRMSKKNIEMSKFCGVDCFGKLSTQEIDHTQIDDSIKIFDEKDPAYRQKIFDKLAAGFEKGYRAVNDHGSAFMESR